MKRIIASLFIVFVLLATLSTVAYAKTSSPIDEIQLYEIKIDPRTDGTLDMIYKIEWKVLDDKSYLLIYI